MLKHPEKLEIMQRLALPVRLGRSALPVRLGRSALLVRLARSPQPPGVLGGRESREITPQLGDLRGANQSQERSPQPPLVRGANEESGERSPQPPLVRGANEESREISPQPPLVRGANEESRERYSQKGLTNRLKESKERLKQLQLLQLRLGSKNQLSKNSNQSGFTLIECLLAIMIVAILLSAVAPVIVLSIATRLQARRVEQGAQAAQTYIDGVRAGKIFSSAINPVPLDEVTVNAATGKRTFAPDRLTFSQTPAPGSNEVDASNCVEGPRPYPYCSSPTSTLYCVDLDGGGCSNKSQQDLIVQAFRSQSPAQATAEGAAADENDLNRIINKNGFLLGVRVYRANSFNGSRTLIGGTGEKDVTFTGGTGLKDTQAPLVEVTTEISARDSISGESKDTTSYTDMCARLGGCDPTP